MMVRTECLTELARVRGDALVVAVYSAAFDWIEISPHPLNFFSVGAMGQASSHALGFAIGLPDRRVIVLDGDGSLLMNLSSLVTIAGAAPTNLMHFVCQNGCYEVMANIRFRADSRLICRACTCCRAIEPLLSFQILKFSGLNCPELFKRPVQHSRRFMYDEA